jgi:hypothetical protein
MSATYIDFDETLQAAGYRAKTWDGRYFTIVAPGGEEIGTTPFQYEIKDWAETHHKKLLEEAHALKKPLIEIWRFADAPREYQALSGNGGDEDFIVIVRHQHLEFGPTTSGGFLGVWHWSMYPYEGLEVWIGAHA